MEFGGRRCFNLVICLSKNLGLGLNNQLPWKIPPELRYFKQITTFSHQNTVIMGRKTWESIPPNLRPLAGRKNIVISSTLTSEDNYEVYSTLEDALTHSIGEIFVIGGTGLFIEVLSERYVNNLASIYLTRLAIDFEADVFFPSDCKTIFDANFLQPKFKLTYVSKSQRYEEIPYDHVVYTNDLHRNIKPITLHPIHEELQYLELVNSVIKKGISRGDRTGVGTVSIFGSQQRWDLSQTFPLLTTKAVFWRGVVEELLWFIKGDTNSLNLSKKGVKIWEGNGSKAFLEAAGLGHREEGDLGPVYGFQWRHFGAKYVDMNTDYTGQGKDQLMEVIHLIKNDPNSRRIVMTAWNPAALHEMALPPCHMFCQFYVAEGKLSCLMYQRSCDLGLGVPFNIASYSLLTYLLAQVCDLQPGEFIHTTGDTHVYTTHVEPLQNQLERTPNPFPILKLNPDIKDIEAFTMEDIQLIGYVSHSRINMPLAI